MTNYQITFTMTVGEIIAQQEGYLDTIGQARFATGEWTQEDLDQADREIHDTPWDEDHEVTITGSLDTWTSNVQACCVVECGNLTKEVYPRGYVNENYWLTVPLASIVSVREV